VESHNFALVTAYRRMILLKLMFLTCPDLLNILSNAEVCYNIHRKLPINPYPKPEEPSSYTSTSHL